MNKLQSQRAFEVGTRLREQCWRLHVPCSIAPEMPTNGADLAEMERAIQKAASRLSRATGIMATSLEALISEVEFFGTGATRVGPWQ
jgi:hypothetical protein